MILIDANIFMYAAGAEHPHKAPSIDLLRRVALGEIDAAVESEVLQEILHRDRSIRCWDEGREVYALARRIVPLVVAITEELVDRARDLLDGDARLGARDAVQAAVAPDRAMQACAATTGIWTGSTGCGDLSGPCPKPRKPAFRPANDEGPVPFETGPPSGDSALIRTVPDRQRPPIGPVSRAAGRAPARRRRSSEAHW